MPLSIRDATPEDAPLIAWVEVEAARSGTPLGFWDVIFPGADQPRLSLIEQIVRSPHASFAHYTGFIVAELDGAPVGAMSGYDPTKKKLGHFARVLNAVLEKNGWNEAHRNLLGMRLVPAASCLSDTPADCWIVEWVALRPEARGKGVAAALLERILQRGRDAGFAKAQISYLIGNTPAQRCYEGAGFETVDEKRDPAFEAIFGRPGTARMLRAL